MAKVWQTAVLAALDRYSARHSTRIIDRQQFLGEELANVVKATKSRGKTPHQTLSKTFQELRDDGQLEFLSAGRYLLLDRTLDAESEELPEEALDTAIRANKLVFASVPTGEAVAAARRRRGQDRLRSLCLSAYKRRCAVCDTDDEGLLVASHIVGWAESPSDRGLLANVICLCRTHDALFERGYWTLRDDFTLLVRPIKTGTFLHHILDLLTRFDPPLSHAPEPRLLRVHRDKSGIPFSTARTRTDEV